MSEIPRHAKVTLLDLGLGNLHSVVHALDRIGCSVTVIEDSGAIAAADRLIVPGQGGFAAGSKAIEGAHGDAVKAYLESGRPYLGICLGMQLLFESSEEAPGSKGLGVLPGKVSKLKGLPGELKVPHMGWNQIDSQVAWLKTGSWFYFVHSYVCEPRDMSQIAATTDYGGPRCAAVQSDNIWACQFHPEKSHAAGTKLLQTWLLR